MTEPKGYEGRVWRFKSLSPEEQEVTEGNGCQVGHWYWGEFDGNSQEVGCCLICEAVIWPESWCEHVAYFRQYGESSYEFLSPKPLSHTFTLEGEEEARTIEDILNDDNVHPPELEEKYPGLIYDCVRDLFSCVGIAHAVFGECEE